MDKHDESALATIEQWERDGCTTPLAVVVAAALRDAALAAREDERAACAAKAANHYIGSTLPGDYRYERLRAANEGGHADVEYSHTTGGSEVDRLKTIIRDIDTKHRNALVERNAAQATVKAQAEEIAKLQLLFQQSHGCHHGWVSKGMEQLNFERRRDHALKLLREGAITKDALIDILADGVKP
jgi:hypothetical protein